MTMPTTDFNVPRGSFPTPIKPIGVAPLEPPLVELKFNFAWCQVITGALSQLLLQSTWDVETQAELTAIQQDVFDLMATMCANPLPAGIVPNAGAEGEQFSMIRQDPDNPCLLQSSIDGINWCTWADITKCAGVPNQTGNGTPQPQPGGGTMCYTSELPANGSYWIPTPLNAGDVVDVTFSGGLWADPASPLPRCPDGTIFMGLGCVTGTEFTNTGDPMPAKPHMSIIVEIAGTNYAQVDGLITVPSGVVNAMARVFANTNVPNSASGSAQIKVCVTNNAPASWSSEFDFTLSAFSWIIQPDTSTGQIRGQWLPGVGFASVQDNVSGIFDLLDIHIDFAAANVSSVELLGNFGGAQGPALRQIFYNTFTGSLVASLPSGAVPFDVKGNLSQSGVTSIWMDGSGDHSTAGNLFTKCIVTGTGTKPAGFP